MKKLILVLGLAGALVGCSHFGHHNCKEKSDCGSGGCKMKGEITPEMRAKTAKMHEDLASCLKSTKPIEECHKIKSDFHSGDKAGSCH